MTNPSPRSPGSRPVTALVVGFPDRLVADNTALLSAARSRGLDTRVVSPSLLGLAVADGEQWVTVDGSMTDPDLVIPRGINRAWPLMRQILEVWERRGVSVFPNSRAIDRCIDKLVTIRALNDAGIAVLPTIGVAPGPGVALDEHLIASGAVTKPARASKARGVEAHPSAAFAAVALGERRPLVGGSIDHHLAQPLASSAGTDYRVVVGRSGADQRVEILALTRRTAPEGEFVTNRTGASIEDVTDPQRAMPDVCELARRAADCLDLEFGGIDVIEHEDRMCVLEVNAWPGLALEARGPVLADALIDSALATVTVQRTVIDGT